MPPTMRPAGTPSSGGWMRHLDSTYGTNPAIVPGATPKNTNDPSTAPTVLVTLLLPHHAFVFRRTRDIRNYDNPCDAARSVSVARTADLVRRSRRLYGARC